MSLMRVAVSQDDCIASGFCRHVAPAVFGERSDGVVIVSNPNPPEELREQVESAVAGCPARVIRLESD